jgi:hypothetical protein
MANDLENAPQTRQDLVNWVRQQIDRLSANAPDFSRHHNYEVWQLWKQAYQFTARLGVPSHVLKPLAPPQWLPFLVVTFNPNELCASAEAIVAEKLSAVLHYLEGTNQDNEERVAAVLQYLKSRNQDNLPSTAEEWLPASVAVERAEEKGYQITISWLTRNGSKAGVQIRSPQLPGRHKKEVEWGSLAKYLLANKMCDQFAQQEDGQEASEQEMNQRIQRASKKKRERSLD